MLSEPARRYLLHGLAATPVVVDRMMRAAKPEDYDRRPDPERFTLREVLAHLADWEAIWLERMQRIHAEDRPTLSNLDEGQRCIDGDYAHADVAERQATFRAGRERLVEFLSALAPGEWERAGEHALWGPLTLTQMATLILGHDGYHTRQIADWLAFGDARLAK